MLFAPEPRAFYLAHVVRLRSDLCEKRKLLGAPRSSSALRYVAGPRRGAGAATRNELFLAAARLLSLAANYASLLSAQRAASAPPRGVRRRFPAYVAKV